MSDIGFAQARFGLGARAGEQVGSEAKGWALAQLDRSLAPVPDDVPDRRASAEKVAAFYGTLREFRDNGQSGEMDQAEIERDLRRQLRQSVGVDTVAMVNARARLAIDSDAPMLERMVHFWSNHFATSGRKPGVFGFAGNMEFDAIRPHVMGRFEDMLLSAEAHPAMLLYLDQAQSIGPDSMIGRGAARRGRDLGINENLAREILELHTLGVDGGYSQADVTEFAHALTGWTVAGLTRGPLQRFARGEPGETIFVDAMHQPGSRTIIGQRFGDDGPDQAAEILRMLARHPSTARHMATKLARHFAADEPPPAMVARIEQAWLASQGSLPTVYRAIIDSPEAWEATSAKFRNPWDWTIASLRAMGGETPDGRRLFGILNELGQPTWQVPSPAGWDDVAGSWAGPDALVRRVEAAQRMAGLARGADARDIAPAIVGTRWSETSAQAVRRAASATDGFALFLVSPEMLRR
ncbi:DUF1800 domain-containing protein [Sphingomicrobium sediminis]|uniref:DUF1800 domain-containing protein n=1 Tax=Sphingomicrobium sediminis TaxID=2950949 RepID=A0A9X2EHF5_9SPHN|nr:DUF1800 domain-containing protein [Sphingomicrobium sediminis]MCM8557556.1 DUF1800 domain-containing protein [Sphingomicrobium sediminis]